MDSRHMDSRSDTRILSTNQVNHKDLKTLTVVKISEMVSKISSLSTIRNLC